MTYEEFLQKKREIVLPSGIDVELSDINSKLFDYQRDIVKWALKKGKAALFEGCGLGKSFQQLEWARLIYRHTSKPVLILAPLAVAPQTVKEGCKLGVHVNLCRTQAEVIDGINITNYEMLEHFNADSFNGVVLDESSILKNFTGKIRNQIIEAFRHTPYKLACTATPAPNDHMELGSTAEFLGVMTRAEMLATYFIHDGGNTSKWRLKKHAVKDFWKWVANWAVMMQNPADLGYDGSRFVLPEINIQQHTVITGKPLAKTLNEQRQAARGTLAERVKLAADIANSIDDYCIIWCNLNDESTALTAAINGAVEVKGSDKPECKEHRLNGFSNGDFKKLVSKASIAGFGMNWQHCNNMIFVGMNHSFEQYYQAVRRIYRFGQERPVNVHMIAADVEGAIVENIKRKETDFNAMLQGMIAATQEITSKNVRSTQREESAYNPQVKMILPKWLKGEVA